MAGAMVRLPTMIIVAHTKRYSGRNTLKDGD